LNDSSATLAAATASLARRLSSLCYEVLLLAAVLFVANWIFLVVAGLLPAYLARLLLQLFLLAICAAYFIYCWSRGRQTLPMKTWRIHVITRDGAALSPSRAALRFLFAILSVALGSAGFWWALIDHDRQFLHDRLAGTRLIQIAD
jgi:uncharacterized RDD family membrane protein YckC